MSGIQIQSGVAIISGSAHPLKRFTVSFPKPFTEIPVFVANTLQDTRNYPNDINDTFAVSVKIVSTTQAVVQVYRVDASLGWAQNLQLGWTAISS